MSVGQEGSLGGFVPFTASSLWNKDISAAAVDPNSASIIKFIGGTASVHPDFGAGTYDGSSMGIPYVVVGSSQKAITIHYTDYGDESEPGPMPVPATAPIEGYPNPGDGDRHVLVLNQSSCWLYELYSAYPNSDGSWNAASAAVWDINAAWHRPYGWTSADAAGLPIFAGLVRYDEVAAGHINHAIRFTLQHSRAAFTPPATHWAANSSNAYAAPMGMRVRLKASYNIAGFSKSNQVILTAMKKYGLIMADNGSNMYISGTPDSRWNNDDLHNLSKLKASDFEVVKMSPVYTKVPTGANPVISSFKASSYTVAKGSSVALSWTATGASYFHLTPTGMVRGSSYSVTPSKTTTYTLTAFGPYGTSKATLTVNVQ